MQRGQDTEWTQIGRTQGVRVGLGYGRRTHARIFTDRAQNGVVAARLVQVLHMLPLLKVENLGTRRRVEGWVFLDLKGQVGFFDQW